MESIWEAKEFELMAFKMKEDSHIHHLREVKFFLMVANSRNPLFGLDHCSAKNMMTSSICAYDA